MATECRTALVTGASAGLGAAIALEMAARGWRLAIGARRLDRLTETAEKARAQGAAAVYAGELDVTDDASVERFFDASEAAVGMADVIVNNAGASRFHWLEETDPRWLRSEVETNLIGPMVVTHRALRPLLAAQASADVVMVSSDASHHPRPGQLAYGASKAGLENYANALSLSLEGTGIRVIKVRLGPALSEFAFGWDLSPETTRKRTEHWASFGLRDARMMTGGKLGLLMPDDVARAIVHAVTQPPHVLIDTIELQPAVPRTTDRQSG
ncbi:MAG TPA: SDR family NAD(P)-dependent oxidoreductase [Candidatus Limnocylindria bacterium]|nr:SDR family NAD(P)-dependent oxidoreductase [Candidatus Limnocylindria bacterium]